MFELWQNRELRAKIEGLASGCAIATFVTFFIAVQIWTGAAPSEPNEALGAIFEHNEHGSITYFTAFQSTSAALMFWISFAAIAIAIFTRPKRGIKVRRLAALPLGAGWTNDDNKGHSRSWGIRAALVAAPILWILGQPLVRWLNHRGFVFNF